MTSSSPMLAGVLGWPVGHSLSPLLHGHWIKALGLHAHYVPLPCTPDDIDVVVPALLKTGFRGFNVTVPHKEAAFRLAAHLTARAKAIGAVNTLWLDEAGLLNGDSTDGAGFLASLPPLPPGHRALVLGAGGAAKAVAYALADDAGSTAITIANRTLDRAQALCAHLRPFFPQIAFDAVTLEHCKPALSSTDLIVNTTSLGMVGQPSLALDLSVCDARPVVYDIVYTPLLTPLLTAAQARGFTTINGLAMLIGQARPGFAHWFGKDAPHTGEEEALLKAALEHP